MGGCGLEIIKPFDAPGAAGGGIPADKRLSQLPLIRQFAAPVCL